MTVILMSRSEIDRMNVLRDLAEERIRVSEAATLRAVLAGNHAEAVVLDFMQPDDAGGRSWGFCGQARLDEAGGQGTRT
jgi:hypothetical protein